MDWMTTQYPPTTTTRRAFVSQLDAVLHPQMWASSSTRTYAEYSHGNVNFYSIYRLHSLTHPPTRSCSVCRATRIKHTMSITIIITIMVHLALCVNSIPVTFHVVATTKTTTTGVVRKLSLSLWAPKNPIATTSA